MEAGKTDTCAVLDAGKRRLARGRYDLVAGESEAAFLPASSVTPEEMLTVAFLWPDGEDMLPVASVRPAAPGELRFHLTLAR